MPESVFPINRYLNDDQKSFAYISARERWPVIITGQIDDVSRAIAELDAEKDAAMITEGKAILSALSQLKYDLEHDKPLKPLEGNADDIPIYNKQFKARYEGSTWGSSEWLYSECHMYRQMFVPFESSQHWAKYDYFSRQKEGAFKASATGVTELALRYKNLSEQLTDDIDEETLKLLFREFTDISLWGNATDLSLLATMSLDEIKSLQGAEVRKKNEEKILINDVDKAWDVLLAERETGQPIRVDFVLDNSGFELYADLIMILFLLDANLANYIVLHPKSLPWFVSDVMPMDVLKTFNYLASAEFFPENRPELEYLVEKLVSYHQDGRLLIRTSPFWTTGYSFWEINPNGAGGGDKVYEDLKESTLVIYKGDLNYRKLTGDGKWDRTTSFATAIGPLAQHGLRTLSLRTCKADVVVGLKEGEQARLEKEWIDMGNSHGLGWCWSGKWAVICFSNGEDN
ncbi:DUF89-domain-containing protein [Nadsonia fulvescens var. elongata DSM 6958]|uniref:Sugar phosphate phosphatase n=1 Tax=Nadsonia fulvescens var. elongata DSM 6958 TaxID=857566 RepID=A0A1E3PDH3_9ASCO|nr:DUF89-domain-containing protein [Nadsonia fulvescens var. elongata DSM 6958]